MSQIKGMGCSWIMQSYIRRTQWCNYVCKRHRSGRYKVHVKANCWIGHLNDCSCVIVAMVVKSGSCYVWWDCPSYASTFEDNILLLFWRTVYSTWRCNLNDPTITENYKHDSIGAISFFAETVQGKFSFVKLWCSEEIMKWVMVLLLFESPWQFLCTACTAYVSWSWGCSPKYSLHIDYGPPVVWMQELRVFAWQLHQKIGP